MFGLGGHRKVPAFLLENPVSSSQFPDASMMRRVGARGLQTGELELIEKPAMPYLSLLTLAATFVAGTGISLL